MAQFVMQDLVNKAGLTDKFFIDSAATSREALGCSPDLRTVNKLKREGIPSLKHRARQVKASEYDEFDYIIIMDDLNLTNISRIIPNDDERKIHKLLEYAEGYHRLNIADPWYTLDFDTAFIDIKAGCEGLLKTLSESNQ